MRTLPTIGESMRSHRGGARIAYRPDWDAARPFVLYRNGAALGHYPTAHDAQRNSRETSWGSWT
jgi:hypothetical protein